MLRLKARKDFLAAARSRKFATKGLVLQYRDRADCAPARVGFTATKKIGNAVIRNRAKRRLRELARLDLCLSARVGGDYVLIARGSTANDRSYAALKRDLETALEAVHRPYKPKKTRAIMLHSDKQTKTVSYGNTVPADQQYAEPFNQNKQI